MVGWFLYPWISDFLLRPYRDIASRSIAGGNLIATSPVEGFAVRVKITLYVAIAFAMPVILWQIWRFVSPGLYKHERRYAWPFVMSGAHAVRRWAPMLAYWTLPKALDWLSAIGGNNITQAYTADKYYQLIAYMMLAFGICFEFPIVLVFLQMAGIVSNEWLRKYRRHAIVVIFVIVAVATPSNDPISLLALSLPLCVFYEVAIVVGPASATGASAGRRLLLPVDGRRRRVPRLVRLRARPVPAAVRSTRSTRASPCSSPRPPGRARPSSPSTRWTSRCASGGKAFYTAPIKALSNQKFGDLVARYGSRPRRAAHGRQQHQRRRRPSS